MKMIISGGSGQLAKCTYDKVSCGNNVLLLNSTELDITNFEDVSSITGSFNPDVIINAAAYTAVDKAEIEPEIAAEVNSRGPKNLAIAAKTVGAKFIHISTDYVFDGSGNVPYKESDPVNPSNVYGKTKLAGELIVRSVLPEAIILRTSWVFSEYGNNFVKTMLRIAKDRDQLGIVSDQIGCPTYAGDIASAILSLINKNAPGGVYHYCGNKSVSWANFAEAIFEQAVISGKLEEKPIVKYIKTESYPTPADRPLYSVLSTEKVSPYYPPSDWSSALVKVINRI